MNTANKWEGKGYSQADIDANEEIKERLGLLFKGNQVKFSGKTELIKNQIEKLDQDRLDRELNELMAEAQRDSDSFGAFS